MPPVSAEPATFNLRSPGWRAAYGLVCCAGAWVVTALYRYYYRVGGAQRHHVETAWMWFLAITVTFAALRPAATRSPGVGQSPSKVGQAALFAGFVGLAFGVYISTLRLGFLSDDFVLAARAARNEFLGPAAEFFRPLSLLVYKLGGTRPVALHAFNIVLHGVNSALVVPVALSFGLSPAVAIVAGGLFLTYPGHVEAVAWSAGVQDLLMTALTLAAIVMFRTRPVWAAAPLAAALLAKETAVAAPALAWLSQPRRWRVVVAGAAVVIVYAVLRITFGPVSRGYIVAPTGYLIKELLVRPFATLTVPLHSEVVVRWPLIGVVLASSVVVLVIRAAAIWQGDRRTILTLVAATLWVLLAAAPVYTLLNVTGTLQGARYLYLPACGWAVLIAALLAPDRSRWNLAISIALCAAGGVGVMINLRPWSAASGWRDEILARVTTARTAGCVSVWVSDVPDSIDGAYVFRNGLAEAIDPIRLDPAAPPQCRVSGGIAAR